MIKTSIRFFENVPVRALWDDDTSKWWFCAMDIAEALTKSTNPRSYWNALKRRKKELSTICRQLKLKASDGKSYLTDVVDENGVNIVTALIPAKNRNEFVKWLNGIGNTIDERSKQKAYELFENGLIELSIVLQTNYTTEKSPSSIFFYLHPNIYYRTQKKKRLQRAVSFLFSPTGCRIFCCK